jgi:hypothetical protein
MFFPHLDEAKTITTPQLSKPLELKDLEPMNPVLRRQKREIVSGSGRA